MVIVDKSDLWDMLMDPSSRMVIESDGDQDEWHNCHLVHGFLLVVECTYR